MAEELLSDNDKLDIPDTLPMLPVRDVVVFPYMILPLFVGRDSSVQAVDEALSEDRLVFLASQRNASQEDPLPEDIFEHGTVAIIMRMRKLPDGRVKILVQGLLRAKIKKYIQTDPFYLACIDRLTEPVAPPGDLEVEALMRDVRENLERVISLGKILSPDILTILDDVDEPGRLADLVASNLGMRVEVSQLILETSDPIERLKRVNENLIKEAELLGMQQRIQSQAKEEMTRMQREYFLREQMRAIKAELGDGDSKLEEIEELREKIFEAKMPEEAEREALKQLQRLEGMHPDAAEASMVRGHLDWLIDVPWSVSTRDSLDLKRGRKILDEDHYGLEKIKERILEFLGVRKLRGNKMKGPILCFIGPPGVGKTSLGKSIARALGRKFVRVALGGVRDEAEIRGHRRTYVGSMPGRVIQGLKQAGTNNPVFMIDEVDKLGSDAFRGDPSSALLEVLDPEQNDTFRDHYLNVPYDLSSVMFIATANQADPIPAALADRMEVIRLSGYTEEDKVKIAREYLIPKQLEEHGITEDQLTISASALQAIISGYTREAGLRNLEREIAALCRKIARAVAEGEKASASITTGNLHKYLGPPRNLPELEDRVEESGVATGLAWTQTGGQILFVEATIMEGKGSLTLTGHLGEVMKESARAALSYTRSRAQQLGIDPKFFSSSEVHIHVPSGAIPKDGPSAGVTMGTALVSALTGISTRPDIAMTGEISLRGRVLPVGGVKEKLLAARRAGIKTVLLPAANEKDLEEIPPAVRKKLDIVLVKTLDEVLDTALVEKPRPSRRKGRTAPPEVAGTA